MGAARPGDQWQEGFWDAIDRGEIMIQRCPADHYQFPGGPNCARCGRETRWTPIEGTARIWSSVVFHHRYLDAFSNMLPYPVLLLELSEGPRMYTGLHPEETLEPRVGAAVRLEIVDYPLGPVPMARLTRDPQDRPNDGGER
jgi:uncharacterized OB-fold protein